jgi:hypothetical protein
LIYQIPTADVSGSHALCNREKTNERLEVSGLLVKFLIEKITGKGIFMENRNHFTKFNCIFTE